MYVCSKPVCCSLRCIYNPVPILPRVAGAADTGLHLAEARNDAFYVTCVSAGVQQGAGCYLKSLIRYGFTPQLNFPLCHITDVSNGLETLNPITIITVKAMSFPKNATLSPVPFKIAVPQKEIDDFKTLLQLSQLPPPIWEGTQPQFGVQSKWMSETKEYWETKFDW